MTQKSERRKRLTLRDRSRLNLEHDAWVEESGHAQERAYRLASRLRKDRHHLGGFRHETFNICGVEVQANDVRGFHVRGGEHLDQIFPRKLELRDQIAWMHRGAVRVVRGLTGHVKHP